MTPFPRLISPEVDYSVEGACPRCGKHDLMVMDQTIGCGSCSWDLWGISNGTQCHACGGCCCDYTDYLKSTHINSEKHSCPHCEEGIAKVKQMKGAQ